MWDVYDSLSYSQHIGEIVLPSERIFSTGSSTNRKHFGTLSYDSQVAYASGVNLDGEIEGYAGIQYLPCVSFFMEQDNLDETAAQAKHYCFLLMLGGALQMPAGHHQVIFNPS